MEQEFQVDVKAIFIRGGKMLVLKKNPHHHHGRVATEYWDFPGGRIQKGSSDLEGTLKREVKEELGASGFSIIRPLGFAILKVNPHSRSKGLFLASYLCRLAPGSRIRLDLEEHTEYRWVAPGDARRLLTFKFPDSFLSRLSSLKA